MKLNKVGPSANVLEDGAWEVLFSYSVAVAARNNATGEAFRTARRHSVTTSGHVNAFLSGAAAYETKELPQETFDDLAFIDLAEHFDGAECDGRR